MKKLLGSTLALAMLFPAIADAQLLKNFKLSGSLETDAVNANNVTDFSSSKYDTISTVQTRLMVHGDWDLLDDVHAHVSIDKNDRAWGTASQNVTGAAGVLDLVTIDESYIKIDKLFGAIDTTLGRQYYGDPGDLIIYFGPKYNEFGMPITALDGGRFDWNAEKVGVTLLGAKQTDANTSASTLANGVALKSNSGDKSLWGLDVHVKPTDGVGLNAYVYDRTTVNSGNAGAGAAGVVGNDILYVGGLKAKVSMGGLFANAEFAKDFGQNRTLTGTGAPYAFSGNYTGWAGKADAGYKADTGVGAFTGWGSYGLGSGGNTSNRNFQAIAGDYRPGGIYGRFIAAGNTGGFGANVGAASTLTNLQIIGVGVKANPSALSKLTAAASWYDYRFTNVQGANNTALAIVMANGGNGSQVAVGNKQIGNEADLDLTWAHSENVSVTAGVGSFQPNGFIKNQLQNSKGTSNSPATLAYMDFSIKY